MKQGGYHRESERATIDRFVSLCKDVGFGKVEVEIANGVPKEVRVIFQSFRVDLTTHHAGDTLNVVKPSDSSHDGGSS